MKAIFHVHTSWSYDSFMSPGSIVRWAVRRGIDYVFPMDHETMGGAVEAREYALKHSLPVTVVPGMEIRTDVGDICGIFLERELMSRDFTGVVEAVRAQGGAVVLPHPCKGHDLSDTRYMAQCDFVEVFNSRTSGEEDGKADLLASKLGLKKLGGSDAHVPWELGNCVLEFETIDAFRAGQTRIHGRKTSLASVYLSQLIKLCKTGQLKHRNGN